MLEPESDTELVQTNVSPSVKKRLKKAADSEDRSLASYIRRVLEQHAKGLK